MLAVFWECVCFFIKNKTFGGWAHSSALALAWEAEPGMSVSPAQGSRGRQILRVCWPVGLTKMPNPKFNERLLSKTEVDPHGRQRPPLSESVSRRHCLWLFSANPKPQLQRLVILRGSLNKTERMQGREGPRREKGGNSLWWQRGQCESNQNALYAGRKSPKRKWNSLQNIRCRNYWRRLGY